MSATAKKIAFFSVVFLSFCGMFIFGPKIAFESKVGTLFTRFFVAAGLTMVLFGLAEILKI
jgi:hypothetical protein